MLLIFVAIAKECDDVIINEHRSIGLTATFSKLFARTVVLLTEHWISCNVKLRAQAIGPQRTLCTGGVVGLLQEMMWIVAAWGLPLVMASLDIRQYFHIIPHEEFEVAMTGIQVPLFFQRARLREQTPNKAAVSIRLC